MYFCNSKKHVELRRVDHISFKDFKTEKITGIVAYTLMSNHFHFLLEETEEGGISSFMQRLGTAYTMYFNKKNDRSGSLLQGPFKVKEITGDGYLNSVFLYIHANPLDVTLPDWQKLFLDKTKTELVLNNMKSYTYSSFVDYSSPVSRDQGLILSKGDIEKYISINETQKSIKEWLLYKDEIRDIEK